MTVTIRHQGACLCGVVSVMVTTKNKSVAVCHCTMCRKWGGGPMFAVEFAQEVNFQGEEHITTFRSSDWAERGFCRHCGTHLFYRLTQSGHYALPVGLLDNSNDPWEITEQIFIEQKPAYYSLAEKTKLLTGEEAFAQYEGQ